MENSQDSPRSMEPHERPGEGMGLTSVVDRSAVVRSACPERPTFVGGLFLTSIQSVRTWATNVIAGGSGGRGATVVLVVGACDRGERTSVEHAEITTRHAPTTTSSALNRSLCSRRATEVPMLKDRRGDEPVCAADWACGGRRLLWRVIC